MQEKRSDEEQAVCVPACWACKILKRQTCQPKRGATRRYICWMLTEQSLIIIDELIVKTCW